VIEVKVVNKSANEILDIVRDLRTQGLIQGQDFDFAFHQVQWDFLDDSRPEYPRYTIFKFHTEKYATLFALKYL
jgi:hypothetical protein